MPIPPPPSAFAFRAEARPDVERLATEFAALDNAAADAIIDSLATQAIARWRLDEAVTWQRVKFRSRLLRAASRKTTEN